MTITSEGGVVIGENITLECPPGAVDDPVFVRITLEDPSKFYGLIVQKDLENDVSCFGMPIINLQPNGLVFKKPVMLITKLRIENFESGKILILHGEEDKNEKITWYDISHKSKIDETNLEVSVELGRFSVVAFLNRVGKIFVKDILARLNVMAFNYTISVLLNKDNLSSVYDELALLFVSEEVYHEQFYREQGKSALVKLKNEGFNELHVRLIDGNEEKSICNDESLRISVCLGEDYTLAESQQGTIELNVNSSVWWGVGEVIKVQLERTKDVRILCGSITVQRQFGCSNVRHFNEQG